ncbi:hypothetical protein DPMN_005693, partial [Dreissena polymorpha]
RDLYKQRDSLLNEPKNKLTRCYAKRKPDLRPNGTLRDDANFYSRHFDRETVTKRSIGTNRLVSGCRDKELKSWTAPPRSGRLACMPSVANKEVFIAKCAEKKQKRVSCSLDEKFDTAKENVMTPAKLGRKNPGHFHIKNF